MHSFSDSVQSESNEGYETIDIIDIADDHDIYYVEKILKYRYNDDSNSFEYYVQWLDCPPAFCSWEEESSILDKDLITEFWQEEQRKENKYKEHEVKLSKLMDGISRINEALLDDDVLERIEQIMQEMPIAAPQKMIQEVNR